MRKNHTFNEHKKQTNEYNKLKRLKGKAINQQVARGPRRPKKNEHRLNEEITVNEVRLIDENGEQAGVVTVEQALHRAEAAGLDLVEVVPNAEPPVCKIIDYGKFRFEEQKKQNAAKKKQHTTTVKEITLRPGTEEHDYQVKLKKIRQFIDKGDKVKVTIRFRGRQLSNQQLGMNQLQRIIDDMSETSKVDNPPRMEGRQMNMMLSPESKK